MGKFVNNLSAILNGKKAILSNDVLEEYVMSLDLLDDEIDNPEIMERNVQRIAKKYNIEAKLVNESPGSGYEFEFRSDDKTAMLTLAEELGYSKEFGYSRSDLEEWIEVVNAQQRTTDRAIYVLNIDVPSEDMYDSPQSKNDIEDIARQFNIKSKFIRQNNNRSYTFEFYSYDKEELFLLAGELGVVDILADDYKVNMEELDKHITTMLRKS